MTSELTEKDKELIKQKKDASRKLLKIFNKDIFTVKQVERNAQVFRNALQQEFYKLRSKKVKTLGITVLKEEEKTEYDKCHNDILKAIENLPIVIAESVLDEFLQAIEGKMEIEKFNKKFKDLEITIKEDEENQPQDK